MEASHFSGWQVVQKMDWERKLEGKIENEDGGGSYFGFMCHSYQLTEKDGKKKGE